MVPIFDGHNDVLARLHRGANPVSFFSASHEGHIDLPRMQAGGFAGGFFAVFVPPDPRMPRPPHDGFRLTEDGYEMPLPPALDLAYAQQTAISMMARLFRIAAQSNGQLRVARSVAEIEETLEHGAIAAVLHLEGAEAIGVDLDALELFYQAGLRSLGLVWSRPNAFGEGVPFAFPRSPDTGSGLTDAGKELVRACNARDMLIDLSHLNERGFWDVAALSDAPLVASHSNAHALCKVARNLTDRQLDAIKESDGLVGVAFDVSMLRNDSHLEPETPLSEIVRHIDYLVERIGIDRVAFGSDFDGATIPNALGDVAGLPALIAELRTHAYDDASIRKLAAENWLRVLRATWGG